MRMSLAVLVSSALGAVLALAAWVSDWLPWPLIVIAADVSQLELIELARLDVLPALLIVLAIGPVNLIAFLINEFLGNRWTKASPILSHLSAWMLVLGSTGLYPQIKESVHRRILEDCSTSPIIAYVDRGVDRQEPRTRGILVVPADELSPGVPESWPYSLLEPGNTLFVESSDQVVRSALRVLRRHKFLEFPSEFDPRSSLDHAARYVAVYCDGELLRAFGRVSDPGAIRIWRMEEDLIQALGLDMDWAQSVPGRVKRQRSRVEG